MLVIMPCPCGTGISYEPSQTFQVTCPTCGESYFAWPTMHDKFGREMPRMTDFKGINAIKLSRPDLDMEPLVITEVMMPFNPE